MNRLFAIVGLLGLVLLGCGGQTVRNRESNADATSAPAAVSGLQAL